MRRGEPSRRCTRAALVAFGVAVAMANAPGETPETDKSRKPSWLPDPRRALFVCVVGDEVTLSWKSEPGSLYTIMYTDKPSGDAHWLPLAGYVRMPGTGRTETLKFRVDPARPRRFNLRVEQAGAPSDKRPVVPRPAEPPTSR